MSNPVQQMIEMDAMLSAIDPAMAKMVRLHALQHTIDSVKDVYNELHRQGQDQDPSLQLLKAKLRAYLMCKGTDKIKTRKAIDEFIALAHAEMEIVMNGGLTVARLSPKGALYYHGDKDDENARQVGDTNKNTIDALEFFLECM